MEHGNSFKQTTIKEIMAKPIPNSPRRSSKALICAVVNKSPVKATKNGSMFSLNLCDEDQSSTIRAVCFNKDIFPQLESKKTYQLDAFKLKRAFGDKTAPELLLDDETKNTLAANQVALENKMHTISQILRGETANERFLNLKAKAVLVGEPRVVGTFPDNKKKRTVLLADETGQMELVLWRERAENVNFKEGDVVHLDNMVASKFNGQLNLTTTFESCISLLEEEIKVAKSAKRSLSKCNVISVDTSVLAIKELMCTYSCLACREALHVSNSAHLVTCPKCSCSFLKSRLTPNHKCMILLSKNNQWFTANSKVSILALYRKFLVHNVKRGMRNQK